MGDLLSILTDPFFDLIDLALDAPPAALAAVSAVSVVLLVLFANG